jgi:hypothetical protein
VFDRFFGGFGMLEATFSPSVYRALKVAAVVLGGLALAGIVARRRELLRRSGLAIVYAAAVGGYLALLHAAAFRSLLDTSDPVITGRYLLPLVALYGVAIALGVSWLPRRWGPVAGGALISGLVILQLSAVGVLFARFYA